MRIAVYADFPYRRDPDGVSCGEAFILFALALRAHGDLVLVGRLSASSAAAPYRIPAGVRFAPLPDYPSLARPPAVARAALASLRRFWAVLDDVDAVLLLGPHPLATLFAVLAAARRRTVVLGVRQDMRAYVRWRRPGQPALRLAALALEAAWLALARRFAVVAVGEPLARRYRRARRVATLTVSLVGEADLEAARADRWEEPLRALSVGRLDPEKNPLLLADVLAALRGTGVDWRLTVCGEGDLAAALERRLAQLGVGRFAELRGYVPLGDGLRHLYRTSDALVHVSRTEGVPQVLFEAFAAGLPVVATAVGGVPAAAGGAALMVPPDDAGAVVAALARLGDPALRARLVAAGRARVREHTLEREAAVVAGLLGVTRGAPATAPRPP